MFLQSRKFIWIFLTLLTALGLAACASLSPAQPVSTPTATFTPLPPTATSEPLALSVNGESVTLVEFNTEVARYTTAQTALGKTVASADATRAVIDDLVSQILLAQAAYANGYSLDDATLQVRIDSLATQAGGADALSKWESDHGYTDQDFRSGLRRAAPGCVTR